MAIPTSTSRDNNTIITTTWDHRVHEWTDNIFRDRIILKRMAARKKSIAGGNRLELPVRYKKSTTGKFLQSDWKDADGNALGRTMIGYDAERRQLALWTFGRDGAAGRGALVESAEGKVWTFAGKTGDARWRRTIRRNDDGTFLLMMEAPDEDGVWGVNSITTYAKP